MPNVWRGYVRVSWSLRAYRVGEAGVPPWCVCTSYSSEWKIDLFTGFIIKVKKILECICVNCGRLKADIVSRVSFPLLVSHPTTQFSGGSLPWRTPSPHCASSRLSRRSSTRTRTARVFDRLIAAWSITLAWCWLGTRLRGEMGG